MLYNPTLYGEAVFGLAVRIQMVPNPTAQQISEFFGLDGQFAMYGGQRGRAFAVEGSFYGLLPDLSDLNAMESTFLSFADGVGRQLYDTRGRTWDNVIFRGEYQPDPRGPKPGTWSSGVTSYAGWTLRYKAMLHGLS